MIGHSVYQYRKELGRILAREHAGAADMIVPVLDSGNAAALGYAEESGIPYETALIRNQYVKRTFIEPSASIRDFRVRIKHNAPTNLVGGKRVVLVEDSIVRGTTLLKLVGLIRQAGATEVHVRVSSPPNIGPCHYGIDTPTREELIAHRHSVEEIRQILGADTLGYLSIDGLRGAAKHLKHGICDACFSDDYPIPVDAEAEPPQLSLFRPVEPDDDSAPGCAERWRERGRLDLAETWSARSRPGRIDTVVTVIPDLYGRLVGKRIHAPFFLEAIAGHGMHVCDYLLACDMEMDPTPGYAFTNWASGYGDLRAVPGSRHAARRGLARPQRGRASATAWTTRPARRSRSRRARSCAASSSGSRAAGFTAKMASELEFFLFQRRLTARRARRATTSCAPPATTSRTTTSSRAPSPSR